MPPLPAAAVAGSGLVLTQLRTATQPAHQALEGVLGLLDPALGLDAYTEVLRRLYGFWSGWEPQVASILDDAPLFGPRRRLHLLAADLLALGLSRDALTALPVCPLVDVTTAAEAIGSLYVMEGSTLGGVVIGRNVVGCLGPDAARSYFSGYGPRTGLMWRSFLAELETLPAGHADQATRGAVATFERLGWWLTRPSSSRYSSRPRSATAAPP